MGCVGEGSLTQYSNSDVLIRRTGPAAPRCYRWAARASRSIHYRQDFQDRQSGIPAKAALKGLEKLIAEIGTLILYVSLDGVGPIHDLIRGRKGAFGEVMAFCEGARQITQRVYLHCVINRINVDVLDEVADYAENTGLPIVYGLVNSSDRRTKPSSRYRS
jgi:hypothetical protein